MQDQYAFLTPLSHAQLLKRAISIIGIAAASALVLPIAFADVAKCDDAFRTFAMGSGISDRTVPDTTAAKQSFCRVLGDATRLYRQPPHTAPSARRDFFCACGPKIMLR